MEKAYLNQLPVDVRSLVEGIEQASGVKIEVIVDPSRARGLPARPDTLACEVNEYGARLLIPAPQYFPNGSVLHELLHISRFLLKGVPRVVICQDFDYWTPELETALTRLDNSIEHLIIVPEELERRPGRKAYWEGVMRRELDYNQSANLSGDALINWVFIQIVLPKRDLIEKASAVIKYLGASDHARRFFDALVPSLHSKENTVRVFFDHLDIPKKAGCLEYIDTRNNTSRKIPLAEFDA